MVEHTQKIRRLLPVNYFSVFDHFMELALKGLTPVWHELFLQKARSLIIDRALDTPLDC